VPDRYIRSQPDLQNIGPHLLQIHFGIIECLLHWWSKPVEKIRGKLLELCTHEHCFNVFEPKGQLSWSFQFKLNSLENYKGWLCWYFHHSCRGKEMLNPKGRPTLSVSLPPRWVLPAVDITLQKLHLPHPVLPSLLHYEPTYANENFCTCRHN